MAPPRPATLAAGLAIVIAALLAQGAMLARALVWDDLLILRQIELSGRWRLFSPDPFGFVRPGKTALFSIFHAAFDARPLGCELASLTALMIAALLFWRLARRLLGPSGALAAALVFAVHPLHVEGAGWPAASNGTWMLIFALLYYLLLLRNAESLGARASSPAPRPNAECGMRNAELILFTLCFMGAVTMKEDAIVLPFTGLLLLLAAGRRPTRPMLAAMALQLALGAAFILWTRAHASATGQTLSPLPYAPWIVSLSAPRFILSEGLYFFWPFHWAYYREVRTDPASFFAMMALGWLAAAALIARVWRGRRVFKLIPHSAFSIPHAEAERTRTSAIPVCFVLFTVIALLPTSNLLPLGNDPFGVRYLTHGGLGLALLAGWFVDRGCLLFRIPHSAFRISPVPHSAFRLLLFTWLVASTIFSNLYHREWSSEERLFTRLAVVNQRAKYLQYLAQLAYGRGRWAESEALARRALDAEPGHADARIVLGMALNQQGRPAAALAEWQAVEREQPGNASVAIHLADYHDTRYAQGKRSEDFEAAEKYYRIAAGSPRAEAETAFVNWGLLRAINGQPAEAIAIWEAGLKRFPNSKELRVNTAIARRQK